MMSDQIILLSQQDHDTQHDTRDLTLCLSKNSNAERISPNWDFASPNTFCTPSKVLTGKTAMFIDEDLRGQRIEIAVITPIVPSEPMNSCFRSNPEEMISTTPLLIRRREDSPVLSFRSLLRPFQIVPSGNTTSNPSTLPCKLP